MSTGAKTKVFSLAAFKKKKIPVYFYAYKVVT